MRRTMSCGECQMAKDCSAPRPRFPLQRCPSASTRALRDTMGPGRWRHAILERPEASDCHLLQPWRVRPLPHRMRCGPQSFLPDALELRQRLFAWRTARCRYPYGASFEHVGRVARSLARFTGSLIRAEHHDATQSRRWQPERPKSTSIARSAAQGNLTSWRPSPSSLSRAECAEVRTKWPTLLGIDPWCY